MARIVLGLDVDAVGGDVGVAQVVAHGLEVDPVALMGRLGGGTFDVGSGSLEFRALAAQALYDAAHHVLDEFVDGAARHRLNRADEGQQQGRRLTLTGLYAQTAENSR